MALMRDHDVHVIIGVDVDDDAYGKNVNIQFLFDVEIQRGVGDGVVGHTDDDEGWSKCVL